MLKRFMLIVLVVIIVLISNNHVFAIAGGFHGGGGYGSFHGAVSHGGSDEEGDTSINVLQILFWVSILYLVIRGDRTSKYIKGGDINDEDLSLSTSKRTSS